MLNLKEQIFIEKYRPRKVDDIVSQHTDKIKGYIKNIKSIPHFLFSSKSPGTGKTSTALAIINEIECDKLILNSSDERKIEIIRDKVKMFSRSQSSKSGVKRCIFFDEFDGMLKTSQNALRNLMETYSHNCFFILTCNFLEKVIEPIQSRCVCLELSNPPKNKIELILSNICINENINDDISARKKLIDRYYPDIRSMIQFLQTAKIDGKGLLDATDEYIDKYEKCFNLILSKKYIIIKDMIFTGEIDPKSFNLWMFKNIFKNTKKIGVKAIKKIIQILADNELAFSYGANEDVIFLAGLLKIIEVIKNG